MDGKDSGQAPLSSEALKRDEWRGKDEKEPGSSDESNSPPGPDPMAGTMLPPD